MADSPARLGRNDLCYCGSGKKFKKCCLNKPLSPEETLHSELNAAAERVRVKIMEFGFGNFGQQFGIAWEDFNFGDTEGPFDPKNPENSIFVPFFLFLWDPASPDPGRSDSLRGGIVAKNFLLEHSARLTDMERQILRSYMLQPLSFYEVLSVHPEKGFSAREILTEATLDVRERLATRDLRTGDILYAQMSSIGGITIMNFCAPFRIPPRMKAKVIELRQILQEEEDGQIQAITERDLILFEEDIRECYLDIRDYLTTPPVLVNTDGDPLEIHTMTFDIESAQAAFDALAPLAEGIPKEDLLLHDAEYDATGALTKVEIPWMKKGNRKFESWENTILAHIRISGRSLEAEVNSEKRARKLRKEIEKRLGPSGAIHRSTDVKPYEQLVETAGHKNVADHGPEKLERDLLKDPELRKKAQEFVQKEFDAWVDKNLPVLGGRTPRQAIKDLDGKEIVESLLLEFERDAEQTFPNMIRPDMSAIRKRLNLPASKRA